MLILIISSKSYSIGSSGSKKPNFSILKKILKESDIKSSLIIKIDDDVTLNLENVVAKLAVTLITIISAISTFSLEILF